jgi:hypothetical protein
MVRRNAFRCTLATLALLGATAASAGPVTLTGNVASDFNPTNPDVHVSPVDSNPLMNMVQLPSETSLGIINGYAIKDIREAYDSKTDTLYIGLNTYGVAGSATGLDPTTAQGKYFATVLAHAGGHDPANIGGNKSITVGFAANNPNDSSQPGQIIALAGVPAGNKGSGLDGFTVAKYAGLNVGMQNNYGATLTNNLGSLAFNPDAAHPNFEFTIKNFSTISPSLDPSVGFWIRAYAGSPDDGPVGEETTVFHVPALAQQVVPEPTTWMAWSLLAGAAAVRLRRRGKI